MSPLSPARVLEAAFALATRAWVLMQGAPVPNCVWLQRRWARMIAETYEQRRERPSGRLVHIGRALLMPVSILPPALVAASATDLNRTLAGRGAT